MESVAQRNPKPLQSRPMPDLACVAQGLDRLYAGRPLQRFWFLETVARMPYFSYISMLHLYESLGWWRAGAELRRVCPRGCSSCQVTKGVSTG